MSRDADITAFLAGTDWGEAERRALAGDASRRRYERLTRTTGETSILMDAPPAMGEDTRPFLAIADHLRGLGLSAPAILADDTQRGLLVMEDLGDALFARVLEQTPSLQPPLYDAAADLLAHLQRQAPPALPVYGPAEMADRARLAALWYRPGLAGRAPDQSDADAAEALAQAVRAVLDAHIEAPRAMILRDYHAENLIWLPDRRGHARVGLLDFQDAALGDPAYDLASLVQDARRDVPDQIAADTLHRYAAETGRAEAALAAAVAVCGVQRALRILGVFARLALRDGKTGYLSLLPRVWGQVQANLAHPACAPLAVTVSRILAAPSAPGLQALAHRAGVVDDPAPMAP